MQQRVDVAPVRDALCKRVPSTLCHPEADPLRPDDDAVTRTLNERDPPSERSRSADTE